MSRNVAPNVVRFIDTSRVMITGYNTDVEYDGLVYHVQTEDKGLENPIILSLVYAGGEILASKRSPYRDLIKKGLVEGALVERLQRQHKLICAAVHAGRIDELKAMSQREGALIAKPLQQNRRTVIDTPSPAIIAGPLRTPAPLPPPRKAYARPRTRISVSPPDEDPDSLKVKLIDEQTLRSAESVTLRIMVSKGTGDAQLPIKKARVYVRILGSTFRPVKASAATDKNGVAEINVAVPEFNRGRAAMLVRAEADKEFAELRRIIQPTKRR